jgi:hypothetical protein
MSLRTLTAGFETNAVLARLAQLASSLESAFVVLIRCFGFTI